MPFKICPECGASLIGQRADAAVCGPSCRKRAWRRRRAERDARIRDLMRLHSATVREGMALLDLEAVRPELERIGAELDALLSSSTPNPD